MVDFGDNYTRRLLVFTICSKLSSVTLDPSKYAELRVQHLSMLQAVIARMSGQGATLKNYCITLATALCGFAVTLERPLVVLLAFLPVAIFALLDTRYLCLERGFRSQYDRVRAESWDVLPTFEIGRHDAPRESYLAAFRSWSIIIFYGPLALGIVTVAVIARCVYGG